MFAKSVVLSDAFLDMPMSARCLYFTLSMYADDDGIVANPKSAMRQCGAKPKDLKALTDKRYILKFDSGIVIIKHWLMNNYIPKDRHKPTTYIEELETLTTDEKGAYIERSEFTGYKNSQGYTAADEERVGLGEFENVFLTDEELEELRRGYRSQWLDYVYQLSAYMASSGKTYENHYATIVSWIMRDEEKKARERG